MKILVVDDEPKIRTGIQRLLNSHPNWQAEAYGDARSALKYLMQEGADVIITDITMPEISGLDMAEEIRRVDKEVPIFILSGYSLFDYAQRAIELNVRKYFTKPTDPGELIAALENLECSKNEQVEALRREIAGEDTVKNFQILHAIQYMEQNYSKKISLADVAGAVYISPNYLSELFRKETGLCFSDYLLRLRMQRAAKALLQPNLSISEVATSVGFNDSRYFGSAFKKYSGLTPREYRNQQAL